MSAISWSSDGGARAAPPCARERRNFEKFALPTDCCHYYYYYYYDYYYCYYYHYYYDDDDYYYYYYYYENQS